MIEAYSNSPTFFIAPNGVVLVWVRGCDHPMTPEQFQAWTISEMYKTSAGRPYVHTR